MKNKDRIQKLEAEVERLRAKDDRIRKVSKQRSKRAEMVGRCPACDGYYLLLCEGGHSCKCNPVPCEREAAEAAGEDEHD